MSDYLIQGSTLTAIADAIRAKTSTNQTFTPSQMASAIMSISGGGSSAVIIETDYWSFSFENDEIASNAFAGNQYIAGISYTNCSIISDNAFAHCENLLSVTFQNCTTIGDSAFESCAVLESINFPNCLYIGSNAFYSCDNLSNINFPNCSYVGENAFADCTGLVSISLPVCENIDNSAFDIFPNSYPVNIYLLSSSVCSNNGIPFGNIYTDDNYFSIHVPASLYNDYIVANGWSEYSNWFVSV